MNCLLQALWGQRYLLLVVTMATIKCLLLLFGSVLYIRRRSSEFWNGSFFRALLLYYETSVPNACILRIKVVVD